MVLLVYLLDYSFAGSLVTFQLILFMFIQLVVDLIDFSVVFQGTWNKRHCSEYETVTLYCYIFSLPQPCATCAIHLCHFCLFDLCVIIRLRSEEKVVLECLIDHLIVDLKIAHYLRLFRC